MISSWSNMIFTRRPHPWGGCYRIGNTRAGTSRRCRSPRHDLCARATFSWPRTLAVEYEVLRRIVVHVCEGHVTLEERIPSRGKAHAAAEATVAFGRKHPPEQSACLVKFPARAVIVIYFRAEDRAAIVYRVEGSGH